MILTALKSNADLVNPDVFFPTALHGENFASALTAIPFMRYFTNSTVITLSCVAGSVFSSSLTAYAFARLRFPFKKVLFFIMMGTMMIPTQIIMIPMFTMYARMNLLNTYVPLIVPAFLGVGGAMYIFLMRQFFMGLPRALTESAIMDGAGHGRIFLHIILPLSRPALITVALFAFIFTWNDFFAPLIYLTDPSKLTLAIGLRAFLSQYEFKYNLMMAGALISMLPTLILFFLAQKQFLEGITFTGIKG
jgi:multiple sugar transport system permease protein